LRVASGPATAVNGSAVMSRKKLVAHGVVKLTTLLTAECDSQYAIDRCGLYDCDTINRLAYVVTLCWSLS